MEPVLASPKRVSNSVLRAAAGVVEHGDVFRLDRVPAPVPFGQLPSSDVAPVPAPPAPARPPLALQGIVGPPWQAVVEGLPDQEGPVVVRGGERFGELKVRSVSRDHVVVVGSDTVWRLTVRNPWQ
jgi:hypothetical protein